MSGGFYRSVNLIGFLPLRIGEIALMVRAMKNSLYTSGLVTAALLVGSLITAPAFAQSSKSQTSDNNIAQKATQKIRATYSFPDGTPVEKIYEKCRDMIIVKVDNRFV